MDFEDKTSVISSKLVEGLVKEKVDSRAACFIVLAGTQAGRMYKLEGDEIVIGRVDDALIRIDDDGVSRRHAKIVRTPDGGVTIQDMGSTNGTFCNGEKVGSRTLQDGDKIQIGSTTILKFSFQDSVEEDFQRRQYESATRDALTGCFNKKYLLERLPSELASAKRHDKTMALAMMDIDHFKRVNDTYGHPAGDYVLRHVADVMLQTVRADDVLARFGGEEFAMIMRETSPDNAVIAAERIRRRIEAAEFVFEGTKIPVTISVGVASWVPGKSDDAQELLALADEFLYKAKRNGRNRTESAELG
ncbi:MAG: diguanylate cyclase [Deltaproteobacteria bacterium]|nr:diguanylate cyclase [Deltaproteobacteria bacterium]